MERVDILRTANERTGHSQISPLPVFPSFSLFCFFFPFPARLLRSDSLFLIPTCFPTPARFVIAISLPASTKLTFVLSSLLLVLSHSLFLCLSRCQPRMGNLKYESVYPALEIPADIDDKISLPAVALAL